MTCVHLEPIKKYVLYKNKKETESRNLDKILIFNNFLNYKNNFISYYKQYNLH